jgi:small-conductance mechanosensitive channel
MKEAILQGLEQAYSNAHRVLADFLPRFVVMLIILVLGLLVALALKYMLQVILHFTNLSRGSEKVGASRVLRSVHLPAMAVLLSRSIFWVIWFGFLLIGLSALGLAGFSGQISRIFQYLPQLFAGILVLFLGLMTANFLSRTALLAAVNAGHPAANMFSSLTRYLIWILTISMTLEELGVAGRTVISAFSVLFGALMLGLAIAFGLGGQDMARKSLEKHLGNTRKGGESEPNPL